VNETHHVTKVESHNELNNHVPEASATPGCYWTFAVPSSITLQPV
jgi:hypothetical protein